MSRSRACNAASRRETVEHGLLDDVTVAQMLDHDALEQLRRDAGVPDAIRIHDDDWAAGAHTQTGRLSSLDPIGTE